MHRRPNAASIYEMGSKQIVATIKRRERMSERWQALGVPAYAKGSGEVSPERG